MPLMKISNKILYPILNINRARTVIMLLLLVSTIALFATQKTNQNTEAYNTDKSVPADTSENNQINKIVSLIKKAKATPTPTISLPGTGNQNSNNTSSITANSDTTLSPSLSPFPTNQPIETSPTPPAATPTPTFTPTRTPTPTSTMAPTSTPVQNTNMSISLYLTPPGNYTLEARANLNMEVIKNVNGYWDFLLSGEITKLMPSREYQIWLCGVNCSSNTEARFNTDENGNKSLSNIKISGHNQKGDSLNRIVIYEMPKQGEEIPNDPTACFMVSNDSIPCLKRELGLGQG